MCRKGTSPGSIRSNGLCNVDYKHWNKEKFYQWTGGNLDIIEENLADILSSKKDVVVRIPLIPDFNADKETIQRMCKKLRDFGAEKIELLPISSLGKNKI